MPLIQFKLSAPKLGSIPRLNLFGDRDKRASGLEGDKVRGRKAEKDDLDQCGSRIADVAAPAPKKCKTDKDGTPMKELRGQLADASSTGPSPKQNSKQALASSLENENCADTIAESRICISATSARKRKFEDAVAVTAEQDQQVVTEKATAHSPERSGPEAATLVIDVGTSTRIKPKSSNIEQCNNSLSYNAFHANPFFQSRGAQDVNYDPKPTSRIPPLPPLSNYDEKARGIDLDSDKVKDALYEAYHGSAYFKASQGRRVPIHATEKNRKVSW